jgi:hypothetical protein
MSPIPGIVASQISGHLTPTTGFVSIATVTLGSAQSTASFTSIPQTYKHLQLRISFLCSNADGWQFLQAGNGSLDTSANSYSSHYLRGYGTGVDADYTNGSLNANAKGYRWGYANTSSATSPYTAVIDILDYTNTNKNKTFRSLNGQDANGSGFIFLSSGLWMSTSAINTIQVSNSNGNSQTNYANYNQYSSFALYGIQGA